MSTVILLVTYVAVTVGVVAFAGLERVAEYEDDTALFGTVADDVLGSGLGWIVLLAIITSALASTQTTILPASRTTSLDGAPGRVPSGVREGPSALPHPARLDDHDRRDRRGLVRRAEPHLAELPVRLADGAVADDRLLLRAHGIACAIYYRRELTKSVKNFFFIGVGPVVGAVMLGFLFVKAIVEYSKAGDSYSGSAVFGVGLPVVIGVGLLILGFVLMLIWRAGDHEEFFGRKREIVDPDVAAGRKLGVAAVPEEAV